MANINFATREVNCKIVFYGPGRSGKTTNLEVIHDKAPKDSVGGDLVSIATETDRTLFFDFLPLDLGTVAGMNTKFQLYTVPGQVYYNATRKLVLQGSDGVVFVADSQKSMRDENIESLNNLAENLAENGLNIADLPLVLQYNKRDLEDIDDPQTIHEYLNKELNAPAFEAIAVQGDGVFKTLKAIASLVIKKLNQESGYSESAPAPAAPAPAPAPAAAPTPVSAPAAPAAPTAPPPAASAPPPPGAQPAAAPPPPPAAPAPQPVAEPTPAPVPPVQAAPEPQPAPAVSEAPAGPEAAPESASEEDLVKKELERKRAERLAREKAAKDRIRKSARKPIKQTDYRKLGIVAGLVVLIGVAAGVVYYFLNQ